TRAVFSSWPVAFWKRRLNCSFFSEPSSSFISSRVFALTSDAFISTTLLFGNALDKARAYGKFGGAETKCLTCDLFRHAVDFEHDAAWFHPRCPVIYGTLALTHTYFSRLRGHWQVRVNPDPHAPLTLHLAGNRAASRLDL